MSLENRFNIKYPWIDITGWASITAVSALLIRECVTVSSHLSQFSHLLGIAFSAVFLFIGGYFLTLLRERFNRWQKALAFFFAGATAVFVLSNAGAADAQFLQNAEDFFTTGASTFGLGNQVALLVSLIFWIIRGAFVIGVAIALLPAIQAAREGDEWRSLAKTPMLVVGIVLAGATSVDFLVGSSSGAT